MEQFRYDPQALISIKFHLAATCCDELVAKLVSQPNCSERPVRRERATLPVKLFDAPVRHDVYLQQDYVRDAWLDPWLQSVGSPLATIRHPTQLTTAKKVTPPSG